jgi:predicted Fe-S protein YdhL (DUF1289 family)
VNNKIPSSPCISVCVLDEKDICMGCYRSADEITDWAVAAPQQKREILKQVQIRILASTTIRLN